MVDFRKLFTVLAVVAILLGSAVTASAQQVVTCQTTAVNPLLRVEGITELIGDIRLNCTVPSGTGTVAVTGNFRIMLENPSINITSRFSASANEPQLFVDEQMNTPDAAATPATLRLGALISKTITGVGDAVDFNNITLNFSPTVTQHQLRITGIRINATQAGPVGSLVRAIVAVSSPDSISIQNAIPNVGVLATGLNFSVTSAQTVLRRCEAGTTGTFANIVFAEGFVGAFRTITQEVPTTPVGVAYPGATNATRLLARFTGIPGNVTVHVTNTVTSGGLTLALLDPAVVNENGANAATTITGTGFTALPKIGTSCNTGLCDSVAVYDVTASDVSIQESATIPVAAVYNANAPVLPNNTAYIWTVKGNFAPISTVHTQSNTAPVPRFKDMGLAPINILGITPCSTTLLFPYVTTAAGFDTGIAVSNTSRDIFTTAAQAGACRVNYFGTDAPGAATTRIVNAGETIAWSSVLGSTANGDAVPAVDGWTGYMIVQCDFQFGHGFAYISGRFSQEGTMGYLPLVLNPPSITRTGNSIPGESLNQ